MQAQSIIFSGQRRALGVAPGPGAEGGEILQALGLSASMPVMVVVGGAAQVQADHAATIRSAALALCEAAQSEGSAIIDGGTASGVMAALGEIYATAQHNFPLIGVAVAQLVHFPGHEPRSARAGLEQHHTHFVLVPGEKWGDESVWLAQLAAVLAGDFPALTVLINGGEVSRNDVNLSLARRRPVLLIQGTGRLADELAGKARPSLLHVVSAHDPDQITTAVRTFLRRK